MTALSSGVISVPHRARTVAPRTGKLHAISLLAPVLFPTYQRIVEYLAAELGHGASLSADARLADLMSGNSSDEAHSVDLAFLCGLQYVRLVAAARREGVAPRFEPLAAPVLPEARYRGRSLYFSDIVVRRASEYTCLADLAGARFAYNEQTSHSGYIVVYYSLLQQGLAPTFFGRWLRTGAHARSLEAVVSGDADAAAIDSHVLAVLLRNDAALATQVRIVGSFGPSTMPPLVVRTDLDADRKQRLRQSLLAMHEHPTMRDHLQAGHIARFAAVDDATYDDIRRMYQTVTAHQRSGD